VAEGWQKVGERGGHVNYLLQVNPPAAVLHTGISHGANSTEYFAPEIRSVIVHPVATIHAMTSRSRRRVSLAIRQTVWSPSRAS
jgi:hypothetical protein